MKATKANGIMKVIRCCLAFRLLRTTILSMVDNLDKVLKSRIYQASQALPYIGLVDEGYKC